MTANETVTLVVETERERRGLSRADLARILGMPPAWVTHKLNGHRRWGMDDLDLLSARLAIPASWFLIPPAGASEGRATKRYTHLALRYPPLGELAA